VSLTVPARGDSPGRDDIPWSYPKSAVFRKAQTVFKDLTLWSPSEGTIRVGTDAERATYEVVDGRYLPTLGVRPAVGRNFSAEEDATPGGAKVVILSDAFWQRRFNADSAVIGRSLSLDGDPFTIVGVVPAGFRGISGRAELFVSFMSQDAQMLNEPQSHGWDMIARLGPDVTPERAKVAVRQLGMQVRAFKAHLHFAKCFHPFRKYSTLHRRSGDSTIALRCPDVAGRWNSRLRQRYLYSRRERPGRAPVLAF